MFQRLMISALVTASLSLPAITTAFLSAQASPAVQVLAAGDPPDQNTHWGFVGQ